MALLVAHILQSGRLPAEQVKQHVPKMVPRHLRWTFTPDIYILHAVHGLNEIGHHTMTCLKARVACGSMHSGGRSQLQERCITARHALVPACLKTSRGIRHFFRTSGCEKLLIVLQERSAFCHVPQLLQILAARHFSTHGGPPDPPEHVLQLLRALLLCAVEVRTLSITQYKYCPPILELLRHFIVHNMCLCHCLGSRIICVRSRHAFHNLLCVHFIAEGSHLPGVCDGQQYIVFL